MNHRDQTLVTLFPLFLIALFLIAIVMLWQSDLWKRQVIWEELADEGELLITPAEYEAVKGDRSFRTRRIPDTGRRTSAALVKAQDELALRKWRVQQQGQDVEADTLVATWRNGFTRLRDREEAIVA